MKAHVWLEDGNDENVISACGRCLRRQETNHYGAQPGHDFCEACMGLYPEAVLLVWA